MWKNFNVLCWETSERHNSIFSKANTSNKSINKVNQRSIASPRRDYNTHIIPFYVFVHLRFRQQRMKIDNFAYGMTINIFVPNKIYLYKYPLIVFSDFFSINNICVYQCLLSHNLLYHKKFKESLSINPKYGWQWFTFLHPFIDAS